VNYFRVSAINAVNTGVASSVVASTPSAAPIAPSPVAGLVATAGDSQVSLSWTAPSNGGSAITDYLIEKSTDGINFTSVADGTSTSTAYTVTGLTNGTVNYFRVSAINAVNTGTASSIASATPAPAVVPIATPTPTPSPSVATSSTLLSTINEPCTATTSWLVRSNVRYAHQFSAGAAATISQAEIQLSASQKYPDKVKIVLYTDSNDRLGSKLGELAYSSISASYVSVYTGSVALPSTGTYWIEIQPTATIANHYYCGTSSTTATGSSDGWGQRKNKVAYGSNSSSWSYFNGTPYVYPNFKLSSGQAIPETVTTSPTVTQKAGIKTWSISTNPASPKPGESMTFTVRIKCDVQMSETKPPYYPSMYYMARGPETVNGVFGRPRISSDGLTATFSETVTAPTSGSYSMYAYARDNPFGQTCTGDSYNFANSSREALQVVAIATPTATTAGSSTPTPTPSAMFEVLLPIGSPSTPVTLPAGTEKITLSTEQLQRVLDELELSVNNSDGAMLRVRVSGGIWTEVDPNNLDSIILPVAEGPSQLEFELVVSGEKISGLEIALDNADPTQSSVVTYIGWATFALVLFMFVAIVRSRRRKGSE
jgi:hypothetical protein